MKINSLTKRAFFKRCLLALVFITIGGMIMIVFSPWHPQLTRMDDFQGRIGLLLLLLLITWVIRKNRYTEKYWLVFYGLFVLMLAISLDWMLSKYLINYLGVGDETPAGWAYQKLFECVVIVGTVIALTKASNDTLGSIYIQKGNLKLGLTIGSVTFSLAAVLSIPMAVLFQAQNLTFQRILPWIPWILIFVLANGTMEEIMFRGLFFRKLEPFFGKFLPNLMVAFIFTGIHGAATYTSDQYIFLAILFPLALAWGYIMQKTDAVWGSILFHAGMDIPILLGIFSNTF